MNRTELSMFLLTVYTLDLASWTRMGKCLERRTRHTCESEEKSKESMKTQPVTIRLCALRERSLTRGQPGPQVNHHTFGLFVTHAHICCGLTLCPKHLVLKPFELFNLAHFFVASRTILLSEHYKKNMLLATESCLMCAAPSFFYFLSIACSLLRNPA